MTLSLHYYNSLKVIMIIDFFSSILRDLKSPQKFVNTGEQTSLPYIFTQGSSLAQVRCEIHEIGDSMRSSNMT